MPRHRSVPRRIAALTGCLVLVTSMLGAVPAVARSQGWTVRALHFAVTVGPKADQHCDVVGDVYTPDGADSAHRVPAVVTTNSWGNDHSEEAGLAAAFAARGYVVLSYDGLGWGASTCRISLDDPDYEGAANRQLVGYLGGATDVAYLDARHTQPAPRQQAVVADSHDQLGQPSHDDPRVGMIGASYGGGAALTGAATDPRIDAIVPIVTWNDQTNLVAPNHTTMTAPASASLSGAYKSTWLALLVALAQANGIKNVATDPGKAVACAHLAAWMCPAYADGLLKGYLTPAEMATMRHVSASSFVGRIHAPTLLMQGQSDDLATLNEAVATYQALKAQRTPVAMVWQEWGHSAPTAPRGEIDIAHPDPDTQYDAMRALGWFDHYLKGTAGGAGPEFSYYRDWVDYTGIATPAYATAAAYPVGRPRTLYLSGGHALTSAAASITRSAQSFTTPPLGLPTSLDPLDGIGQFVPGIPQLEVDTPGTFAQWQTPVLARDLDVVGIPTARLTVSAPAAAVSQHLGAAGKLVLFLKLEDVAPGGTATVIHNLVSPVRIADVTKPFDVQFSGIVHRFGAGHRLRLVVAGGAVNFRGGLVPTPVTIATGSTSQQLTLPITGGSA